MTPQEFEDEVNSTRKIIDRMLSSGFYQHGPIWVKAWYSLSLDWSKTDPSYVVYPNGAIRRLLNMARSDRNVFKLASFVAGTRLECGATLHLELREFAAKVLLREISPPKARPGRPTTPTWGRDFIIIDAMSDLEMRMDIPMTRNANPNEKKSSPKQTQSASDILTEAIKETDLPNLTNKQIDKIWERPKNHVEHKETVEWFHSHLLDDANDIVRE